MSKENKYTLEPVQDIISIQGNEIKQEIINQLRDEVTKQLIDEQNK